MWIGRMDRFPRASNHMVNYWDTFHRHILTLISACISNYVHYNVWDEITYPFPNFNGGTVEVWEWISYFVPHFLLGMIIRKLNMLITGIYIWFIHCNIPCNSNSNVDSLHDGISYRNKLLQSIRRHSFINVVFLRQCKMQTKHNKLIIVLMTIHKAR